MFTVKVSGAEIRHRIYKDTAKKYTSQVNNAKLTKTKSTLHNKIPLKYAVSLSTHI